VKGEISGFPRHEFPLVLRGLFGGIEGLLGLFWYLFRGLCGRILGRRVGVGGI